MLLIIEFCECQSLERNGALGSLSKLYIICGNAIRISAFDLVCQFMGEHLLRELSWSL
jgi:hypothetical protein